MTEMQELSQRVAKLEKERSSGIRFFVQYLLSPLLLLAIGWFFNYKLEAAKQSLQLLELEVKRIEATRGFMQELFSGAPQRAFIAERLISKIVEEKLAQEISMIVKDYYSGKLQESISRKDIPEASKIKEAAQSIPSPASRQLIQTLEQPSYYVVVASVPSEDDAISKAKALRTKEFKSEVILSTTGWYGVTLGRFSFQEAIEVKQKAIANGDAPKDAYIMTPARVVRTVF
jgi:hypothetical protein